MVQRREAPPDYSYVESDMPQFPFKCSVQAGKISASGYATSKKEAKQNCAQNALILLGKHAINYNNNRVELPVPTIFVQTSPNLPVINYVGQLNETASMNGKSYPNYKENIVPINGIFTVSCSFLKWRTEGYGTTKKKAKQDAAKKMLETYVYFNLDYMRQIKINYCSTAFGYFYLYFVNVNRISSRYKNIKYLP